jgi:D-alanine-D-alanine ligase
VKPVREDASVGISSASVVHDRAALVARVRHVIDHYNQPALVEQYVEGREIYVSLLGRIGDQPQTFPFFEIDFSDMPSDRPKIVSFEGKWVEDSLDYKGTRPVRCEGLSVALQARIAAAAVAAFASIEARDYGRVDIRLASDGTPYVIDVNPNCDLSDVAGGFSKAAKAGGLSYKDVILRLVELAMARRNDAIPLPIDSRSPGADSNDLAGDGEPVSAGRGVVRARAPRGRAGTG